MDRGGAEKRLALRLNLIVDGRHRARTGDDW